ncbi:hypothetical protein GCM10017744_098700 [Streptomyces antimycoticus]
MHHRTQIRNRPQKSRKRLAIGDIARHHAHSVPQLGHQLRDARCLGPPTTRQHNALHTAIRQPARHMTTQCPRTTRDQRSATTTPRGRHRSGRLRPYQTGNPRPGGTDRDLILTRVTGEDGGQCLPRPIVHDRRQIDQPAPTIRMLQTDHTAETPDSSLVRLHHVPVDRCDRTPGDTPQRRIDPGRQEVLQQRHRRLDRQQRHHTRDRHIARLHRRHDLDIRTGRPQRDSNIGPVSAHHQPRATQTRLLRNFPDRGPVEAVPPRIDQ